MRGATKRIREKYQHARAQKNNQTYAKAKKNNSGIHFGIKSRQNEAPEHLWASRSAAGEQNSAQKSLKASKKCPSRANNE